MHKPKEIVYNILEGTNTVAHGRFKVDTYEITPDWLYMARSVVNHSYIAYLKAFIIPSLGIQINHFFFYDKEIPSKYTFYDYYVDVGQVTQQTPEQWLFRDLYLDVLVVANRAAHILDTDEYLQAIQENLMATSEIGFALTRTHELMNTLAENNYSLEAYLNHHTLNIDLKKLK
ncbi:MAG: DUF402 domain-containing protein [Trueperaceae bacterium]